MSLNGYLEKSNRFCYLLYVVIMYSDIIFFYTIVISDMLSRSK